MHVSADDIELELHELKILSHIVSSSSLSEAAKKSGARKKKVLDIVDTLNKYGILVFFPAFSKIGLSLLLIAGGSETEAVARKIPHFALHLARSDGGMIYIVLADKKSLPEFRRHAFKGDVDIHVLGEVRGWNTEVIPYLAEKLGAPEKFTINSLIESLEKHLRDRALTKRELKKLFKLYKFREEHTRRSNRVYYVDLDPYDILLLDAKLTNAYTTVSSIARRHNLYRQVLHYHYVNHVLPVWRYNVIMWRDVRSSTRPRLLAYRGSDTDVVEEYFRLLYPTVFTVRPTNDKDLVFILTYLPGNREDRVNDLIERYRLDAAKVKDWELRATFFAEKPFSRIYTGRGWRSIYEDYVRAAGSAG